MGRRALKTSSVTTEQPLVNPEDVGPPADGLWDHTAAYRQRFCSIHEETEWLLAAVDTWMRPEDFNDSNAEAKLEARFQEYQRKPWSFQVRSRKAGCNCRLWSHVDVPINKAEVGEKTIYLIRWKACWTPESNIDDLGWVHRSYQKNNLDLQSQRSSQVENSAEDRQTKNQTIAE